MVKENSEEIAFVWYPNPKMEDALKVSYPELWNAYIKIVDEYQKQGWCIYAKDLDSKTAVIIGDAYYGDGCALSQDMVMAKKPVMIQNFDC